MKKLTHINEAGKAHMVDVAEKIEQTRTAKASGYITLHTDTLRLIEANAMNKGDVLTVAEVAGIQAAKQTSNLIPLCHPILTTKVEVSTKIEPDGISVQSLVRCVGKTGVEMEALMAVNVTLLTIYDMCKAVDKNMRIEKIVLDEKTKV